MAKIYDAEMQYLSVAVAKDAGLDRDGCVQVFESDLISRADAGLRPLLLYALVAPCYCTRVRLLVDGDVPIPLSQFLVAAWSQERRIGMPLRLELHPKVLGGDRGMIAWASAQGVACAGAESIKAFTSHAKAAQDIRWTISNQSAFDRLPRVPLVDANRNLARHDNFQLLMLSRNLKSMEGMTFDCWMDRGQSFCTRGSVGADWTPQCVVETPRALPKRHLRLPEDDVGDVGYVNGIKELIAMWPGGRRTFFKGLDVSAADFDHWAAARADLPIHAKQQIWDKAGVRYGDSSIGFRMDGGSLLIAKSSTGVDLVYTEISHGGDVEFSFEVLAPPGEELDMRVLVFRAWSGFTTLILFPRDGGPAERLLDRKDLINQEASRHAPPAVWQSVRVLVNSREAGLRTEWFGRFLEHEHDKWLSEQQRKWW